MRSREFLRFNIFGIVLFSCLTIGARCQSSSPTTKATGSDIAQLSDGTVSGNVYRNADLGFRYEFPAGWIVNDKATQAHAVSAAQQFVWADDMQARSKSKAGRCSKGLLLVSRYPEEMRVTEFIPMAFLIVADPGCLPGVSFPNDVKDAEAIRRIAGNLGTYFKVSSVNSPSVPRVRAFNNAGRVMLEVSQPYTIYSHEPGTSTVQNVRSSIWIMKAEKYWLMLMFASADDAQLEKLRATSKVFFDSGTK
jgi:hypothetical protein